MADGLIGKLRDDVDAADEAIAEAFARRWKVVGMIFEVKRRAGERLEDASRERVIAARYRRMFAAIAPEIPVEAVDALIDAVLDVSKVRT